LDAGFVPPSRSFLLAQRDRIPEIGSSSLRLRETHDLTGPGSHDYVAVYHGAFTDSLEPLLTHREALGHAVLRADAEDVYDTFNGGRKSPVAIRSFLRYLFTTRGADAPVYLLLVGDGSNDHANVTDLSDFNFMPTMTLPSWASSTQGPEMVSNDEWFVDNLNYARGEDPEEMDFYPDMHIGRLPAGNVEELSVMVRKIIRYENFQPTDHWRNRGIFFADDQYSSTISFTENYCFRPGEYAFERGCNGALEHLFNAGILDFEADSFYLSKFLDTLRIVSRCEKDTTGIGGDPCDPDLADSPCVFDEQGRIRRCICVDWVPNSQQGEGGPGNRGPLAVKLLETLSRGGLFWNVQSHANARLMTHEFVFRNTPTQREDVPEIQNLDKPFIFFGFGCHLAEFSAADELAPRKRDSIGEWLLFHGSSDFSLGAVGSVASTGYEWLSANDQLNTALFDAFFTNPPKPEGKARWIFGEILTAGRNILMTRGLGDTGRGMVLTYTYLGDPALRMDIAPPRLHVTVNEEEVEDGVFVIAADPSDSIHIEVGALDEVAVGDLTVRDYAGPLAADEIEVIRHESRPDRAFQAAFDLGLRPDTYAITMHSTDESGSERIFTLQLELVTEFSVLVEGEERPLEPGRYVPDSAQVIVSVDAPVYLQTQDLEIYVDDLAWENEKIPLQELVEDEARRWRVSAAPISGLAAGEHTIKVKIHHGDQETVTERSVAFNATDSTADLTILRLFNFPNPFEGKTEFHYRLNNEAERGRLSIFTVRGQKIRTLDAPARINDNVIAWDGRDEDGDPVSNGLYFYKLQVWDRQGHSTSSIERIVRAR
jgi:hypothetical protein